MTENSTYKTSYLGQVPNSKFYNFLHFILIGLKMPIYYVCKFLQKLNVRQKIGVLNSVKSKSSWNFPFLQYYVLYLIKVSKTVGSWTLHLRTLHLRMLYLRHFIFGQLNLRAVTPLEISPSGCYTLGMLRLQRFHFR